MNTPQDAPLPNPSGPLALVKELKLPAAVLAADWTPDGDRIFAACLDGGVYEADSDSGEWTRLGRHASYASGACFLPKAQVLVTSGYDGQLHWHDLAERNLIRTVPAHRFWSWKLVASWDERWLASVTGQYRPGGYKYEPAPETEPSVRVFAAATGECIHSFSHTPPVLSAAFSPNGQHLAASNMMGETRVWEMASGQLISRWTTPDFTSWGTVKSHHYIGGIFASEFTPDGLGLLVCGMGPMSDPMAGNGKQTWQQYAWRDDPVRKTGEIAESERGNGLMETIVFHPAGAHFLMAGRLAQGKWNVALFDHPSGKLVQGLDTKMRVTDAVFSENGQRLLLAGAVGQEKRKDGHCPAFGRLRIARAIL